MKKNHIYIIIVGLLLAGAAAFVMLYTPKPEKVEVNMSMMPRKFGEIQLIDSFNIQTSPNFLKSTGQSIILYGMSKTEHGSVSELVSQVERPLKNPHPNKYSRSLYISGDTMSYIFSDKDSLWFVKTVDTELIHDQLLSHTDFSFCYLLGTDHVAVGAADEQQAFYLNIFKYDHSDSFRIRLDDQFNIKEDFDRTYINMGMSGQAFAFNGRYYYKNYYSSYGLIYDPAADQSRIIRTIDSLPFPETKERDIGGGFTIYSIYPEIFTTNGLSASNGRIYSLSNLDATGTMTPYIDVYNENMEYIISYKLDRLKDTKPIKITIDKERPNIIYALYNDIKQIAVYEIKN